jgi:hypothetical protein
MALRTRLRSSHSLAVDASGVFELWNQWRYVCLLTLSRAAIASSFFIANAICMQYDKRLHVQYAVSDYLSARSKRLLVENPALTAERSYNLLQMLRH